MSGTNSIAKKTAPRPPSAMERLDAIEGGINQLNDNQKQIIDEVNNLDNIAEALVEIYGQEAVGAKIVEIRHRKMDARADSHQEAFDKAVEAGQIAKVESSSKSDVIVVTQQANAEGQVLHPYKVFLPCAAYSDAVKKLFGFEDDKLTRILTAGEILTLPGAKQGEPDQGTLTILSLYEPVVKQPVVETAPAVDVQVDAVAEAAVEIPTEQA